MKRVLAILLPILAANVALHAQEYKKSFSLELGTGIAPLHSLISPYSDTKSALANNGYTVESSGIIHPMLSLSGVWRNGYRIETIATVGISASWFGVKKHEVFGVDPRERPRYNYARSQYAGRQMSPPTFAILFKGRIFWNPEWKVKAYSAVGAGFVFGEISSPLPLPEITLVGFKAGGEHFYGFLENTYGPTASFLHGGMGWKF